MIIGITGGIGSGKSTVAKMLAEEFNFQSIEFSTKLKDVCAGVFCPIGVDPSALFGTQEEKNAPILGAHMPDGRPMTGRKILETVGTEGFRAVYSDVWVEYAFAIIDAEGGDWVIPGLRFLNEAQAVWERGGEVWLIECVGGPNAGTKTGHESDEVWRTIKPDRVIIAEFGDLDALRQLTKEGINR